MVLAVDDPSIAIPLGELIRVPVKFIKGKSDLPSIVIQAISVQLQTTGKNLLPVVVKLLGEDKYQATINTQILDAARLAKLDFIWCIVVNDAMHSQMQIETGQSIQINVLTASEKSIAEVLEIARSRNPSLSKLNSALIARSICEHRKTNQPKNLVFLTKLRCGVGKTKLPLLSEYLSL